MVQKKTWSLKSLGNFEQRVHTLAAQRVPAHVVPKWLGGRDDFIYGGGTLTLQELTIRVIVDKGYSV